MKAHLLIGVCCLVGFSSCVNRNDVHSLTDIKSFVHGGIPTKSVRINNDSVSLFVEYAGNIKFSADHSSIISISRNGHFTYRNGDSELLVENEDGLNNYSLSAKGREVRDIEQKKQLFKEAYTALQYTDSLRSQH